MTNEQTRAYARFINARNKASLGQYRKYSKEWQPTTDVLCSVDVAGINHQLFEENDIWIEYKEASLAWWAVEPEFRKTERMSMIRGDYGDTDNWREKQPKIKEM